MMNTRSWKASWTDEDGQPQTCAFVASESYVLAEMVFQASRANQGQPVPEVFTLEVEHVVPGWRTLEGKR